MKKSAIAPISATVANLSGRTGIPGAGWQCHFAPILAVAVPAAVPPISWRAKISPRTRIAAHASKSTHATKTTTHIRFQSWSRVTVRHRHVTTIATSCPFTASPAMTTVTSRPGTPGIAPIASTSILTVTTSTIPAFPAVATLTPVAAITATPTLPAVATTRKKLVVSRITGRNIADASASTTTWVPIPSVGP